MQYVNKKDTIYQQLKERIRSGKYLPESRLPKEIDFAKQLGIGRVTLRSALDILLGDGMIKRVPGKGTFIATANEIKARRYLAILPHHNCFESPMAHIIPSIEQSAAKVSAHIQKYPLNFFRSLKVDEGVERIREGGYSGIFYMVNSVCGGEQDFKIFKATGLPVIMPHSSRTDHATTGFATMRTDKKKAFSAGVKSLAAKGHKRIGTIFLDPLSRKSGHEFHFDEYTDFLKTLDVAASPEFIHYCTKYDYEDVAEIVKKLMRLPLPPTAIMCFSDFIALYVYQALREMKVKIPEQVAIMGYCNYPGGALLSPTLSTVDLFFEKTGHDAFELMLESDQWWKPGLVPPDIYTPFEVIERGSTDI